MSFDKAYWEDRWREGTAGMADNLPNPHLVAETAGLIPGTALEAGCGAGTEAMWLAAEGWQVTGADISGEALAVASRRAAEAGVKVNWVEADLSSCEPGQQFDLVATHYAHPTIPQLEFYQRLGDWVAPGGTLLVVGHLHGHSPAEASVTASSVTALFDSTWTVMTADERPRTVKHHELYDVIVRVQRT